MSSESSAVELHLINDNPRDLNWLVEIQLQDYWRLLVNLAEYGNKLLD
jgi:glycine cleavage system H lipoate-binding protein